MRRSFISEEFGFTLKGWSDAVCEVEAAVDSWTDACAVVGTSTLVRPQRPTRLKHSQHETPFMSHFTSAFSWKMIFPLSILPQSCCLLGWRWESFPTSFSLCVQTRCSWIPFLKNSRTARENWEKNYKMFWYITPLSMPVTEFFSFPCFHWYTVGGAITHLLKEYWISVVKRLIVINRIQNKSFLFM